MHDGLRDTLLVYACIVATCSWVLQAVRTYWQWRDRDR